MEYILGSDEMKLYDNNTIQKIGIPSLVLMEKAAMALLEEAEDFDLSRTLAVCGPGNNGADGIAVARILCLQGKRADVLFTGNIEKATEEAKIQLEIAKNCGVKILGDADFGAYTTIIDSIFGIGLSKNVVGADASLIDKINQSGVDIISADIPSGICSNTGRIMGTAIKAKRTVAFAFKKLGHVLYPGADYRGDLRVKDIGITEASFFGRLPKVHSYNPSDLALLPKRENYSNKGSYGKVLIIGSCDNMNGAGFLSAKAAYRTGAGLVYIYSSENNRQILQSIIPEAVLVTYKEDAFEEDHLLALLKEVNAVVIGPGLGVSSYSEKLVDIILKNTICPIILDGDALNIISIKPDFIKNHSKDLIVTPHLKEMERLTKKDLAFVKDNLLDTAREYAATNNLTCVLKDTRTVVASGTGSLYINQSGSNAMAKGGSGDVLTGIIGGLIAQGMTSYEASQLAVYIHGLSGEEATKNLGIYSVMARDLVDAISLVMG